MNRYKDELDEEYSNLADYLCFDKKKKPMEGAYWSLKTFTDVFFRIFLDN